MNIARFSVSRPVAVTMRIAALVLLGIVSLMKIPIDLLPKVEVPTVAVAISWPNTSPEEMETQIARPLEQAVSTVPGLKRVSSSSSLGSAFVRVEFNYGTNLDSAANDVLQAVERSKGRFPNDDTISEPTVFKFDPSSLPILAYGVTGDKNLIRMRDKMVNDISRSIESAGGVAQVNVGGGQDRAIIVDVKPENLEAYGLSIADISNKIKQENVSRPAGIVQESATEYSLRAVGYFDSLDELRNMPVANVNGKLVTLSQVADVRDASQDIRSFVRTNGVDSLLLTVTKQSEANTVETAKNVRDAIAQIEKVYPGYKFSLVFDQSAFIKSSITDLQETAMIGGVLAILIITFFLRNVRSTFVVALSIPISIISTFSLLYFCGFTINTISLSGLALATGLIVDDAIVVLENIYRHIERDRKRPAEAAVSGTQEILSAVLASTFTVMIVFLPLLMIKGQAGQTFTQFALVVVFSLAISLLDAITVVPMLASRMIREDQVHEEAHPELRDPKKATALTKAFDWFGRQFDSLDRSYRNGLVWTLKNRFAVLGVGLMAVVAAAYLWPDVGREQLPPTDSGDLTVRVKLPNSTAVETTNRAMKQIEGIIQKDPDVETMIAGAGTRVGVRGGGGGGPGNEGSAQVRLKRDRKSKTEDVIKRLTKKLSVVPGANIQVQPYDVVASILGGNDTGISVDLFGNDLDQLSALSDKVSDAMSHIAGLENVNVNIDEATPEVEWKVDREKASSLGVSFSDVAATISAATNGTLSSYYQENGQQYPIYVQVPRALRESIDNIANLPVQGTEKSFNPILLKQVATPTFGNGVNQINRMNSRRTISVGGRVVDRPESDIQKDITAALAKVDFPEGTFWAFGTRVQDKNEAYSGLGLAVVLAIALIYMLLASQFESFIYPLVVLTSVPLCAIGMVLGLFITDRSFGLTAFIGLLMLMGIVVKNGILLVEYTNQLRGRGMSRDEAILTAGPTRLRPILMTTLAAMLGMMPLAIGIGSGSEMYAPLATVVIGGLATSSLLTLFIVPAVYTFFDDLARKMRKSDRDLSHSTLIEPSVEAVERTPTAVAKDE